MTIQKYTISNDPNVYEAWPDVVLTSSGKLVCVFSECTHHGDRSYTRLMLTTSTDHGRTWTAKIPITEGTKGLPYYYNCARITRLSDNRLSITIDRISHDNHESDPNASTVLLMFSHDDGATWSKPIETPLHGIVPDKLLELPMGRLIISAHHKEDGKLTQFMHYSDDGGKSWSPRITVAKSPEFNLCEVSMLPMGEGVIVALMRENSGLGLDCKKVISHDNGESWGSISDLPLPGCHRPTAGFLSSGEILVTYRFLQGGRGGMGRWTQNLFAALLDRESILSGKRSDASARILPIDFDRSPFSDLGYSGWVQFLDGEIYIVNYIVDDAWDKGQIRGYSLTLDEFILKR